MIKLANLYGRIVRTGVPTTIGETTVTTKVAGTTVPASVVGTRDQRDQVWIVETDTEKL